MKRIVLFCVLSIFIFSCNNTINNDGKEVENNVSKSKFLVFNNYKGFSEIKIKDFQDSLKIVNHFLFVPKDKELPKEIPTDITVVRTPLQRLAVLSGTHISFLAALDATENIVAIGESKYITNLSIIERLNNDIVGEIQKNNVILEEKVLQLHPDFMLYSPFSNQNFDKLISSGQSVLGIPDYLEPHPLGRAEWLRFFGRLVNKEELADSLYFQIEQRYHEKVQLVNEQVSIKPTVFGGKPFGGVWYQSGGNSYMATLYKDAGANYIWKNNTEMGSFPLDFETVYAKALEADFWQLIVSDSSFSYQSLMEEDERFSDFSAFINRQVFVSNLTKVAYYEESPVEPDVVLMDLIQVFHPHLLKNYSPKYYKILD